MTKENQTWACCGRAPPRVDYLQYGPAVGPVRTQPEVPAVRSVAPPTVVLALRGVLPRNARPLASTRADPLQRPRLLEPERKRKPIKATSALGVGVRRMHARSHLQSVSSMSASASLSPWGSDSRHSSCVQIWITTKFICRSALIINEHRESPDAFTCD